MDYEKRKLKLVKELKSASLTQEERTSKKQLLHTIESILKVYQDEQKEEANRSGPENKKLRLAMREMAKSHVLRWKVNKALFKQYGGRVLFQQAGMEPIDAYRDFLKEQEQQGNFKIIDKPLRKQFWNYFLYPAKHFLISGEEAKKAINTPLWLMPDMRER